MGNTSSVSIPLALDLARKEGKLSNGDTLFTIRIWWWSYAFRAYCEVGFNLSLYKEVLVSN